jgi:hypothetical protein
MLRNTQKATLHRIGTQRKKRGYKGGASYNYAKVRRCQNTRLVVMSMKVSLSQLAMGVDVQPRHPGSNPRGCEFGFLLFMKKTHCGGLPHRFPFKKKVDSKD